MLVSSVHCGPRVVEWRVRSGLFRGGVAAGGVPLRALRVFVVRTAVTLELLRPRAMHGSMGRWPCGEPSLPASIRVPCLPILSCLCLAPEQTLKYSAFSL